MKKSFISFMALIAVNSLLFAQPSTSDFRGFSWGDSFSQVQTHEKAKFIRNEKDDLLVYQDQLAGSDCQVFYQFNDNNKLVSGTYAFEKKYTNPQLYLQDYDKFKQLLVEKYGKPNIDQEDWRINSTPSDKENYGQAISDGKLTLNAIWSTDRSIIKITLIADDERPSLLIHYTAKSLDELENKEELKSALPKL